MIYPSADKLEDWGNKYALATLAAKRAKQIKSGAPSLIDTDSRNPLTIALEEIAAGRINCEVPDVDTPATPAIEPEVAQLLSLPDEFEEEAEEMASETTSAIEDEASYEDEEEEEEEEEHELWPLSLDEEEEETEEHETPADEEEESHPPADLGDEADDMGGAEDEDAATESEEEDHEE